jgi:hypothetical protein
VRARQQRAVLSLPDQLGKVDGLGELADGRERAREVAAVLLSCEWEDARRAGVEEEEEEEERGAAGWAER